MVVVRCPLFISIRVMFMYPKERGLRSGTVPTPLVVGLGAACELANREMEYDHQHVQRLSDMLVEVRPTWEVFKQNIQENEFFVPVL